MDAAASHAYSSLAARYGEPLTAAGFPAKYAVMGLGKMGGAALGYASDIELLFVYGDSGRTAGPKIVENAEFFGALVRAVQACIRAKREGIFQIDLRLRPYGASGPLACSLESFCTYYAPGGPAHSYERLALVRLRAVGGDRSLGERVERLRDELVYAANGFDIAGFRDLRERQLREKTKPGRPNAKFSSGALVDLEYAVQMLQIRHGAADGRLRTPRIHEAIGELATIGVLGEREARELAADYRFLPRPHQRPADAQGLGPRPFPPRGRLRGVCAPGPKDRLRRRGRPEPGAKPPTSSSRPGPPKCAPSPTAISAGRTHYAVRPANAADLVLSGAASDAERNFDPLGEGLQESRAGPSSISAILRAPAPRARKARRRLAEAPALRPARDPGLRHPVAEARPRHGPQQLGTLRRFRFPIPPPTSP